MLDVLLTDIDNNYYKYIDETFTFYLTFYELNPWGAGELSRSLSHPCIFNS